MPDIISGYGAIHGRFPSKYSNEENTSKPLQKPPHLLHLFFEMIILFEYSLFLIVLSSFPIPVTPECLIPAIPREVFHS